MKIITNDFKDALKQIKQIDVIISYADRENTNYIITQNSEYLLTEAQDFLVTESAEAVIDNGGIQNASIYWNTDIFKSCCKMLDLETSSKIPKGTELNVKVGLLVDGDYEYIDYGKFYTTQESEYLLSSGTYTTTAYDKMVYFNISAKENPLTFEEGVTYTLKQYLHMICNKCGVPYSFDFSNITNDEEAVINGDPYVGDKEYTYRDILDDIAECLGTNFIINADNKITNKELVMTSVMTIDADIIKDTNVYIGEKKEAIDGLQVYDGSTLLNYTGDDTSVFKIKNNNIMSAHSDDLIAGVFSLIQDFEYYTYQLETFGVLALEPFDCFTATYKNTNYLLCSFNNDIKITSGIEEDISYEFTEEDSVAEYKTSSSEDKLKDASIEIDKANGQIVLKADSNGKIVKAELNADADDGTSFNVKADNINLEGYTTINGKFKVDLTGNMEATGGKIAGFNISDKFTATSTITRNYTSNDSERVRQILLGNITPTSADFEKYDLNGDNIIDTIDYFRVTKIVNGQLSPTQTCNYVIDPNNPVHCMTMTNSGDGGTNVSLGLYGGYIRDIGITNGTIFSGLVFQTSSNAEATIGMNASDGNIYCVSLTQTSLEKNKENIKEYTGALKEIMNTDIYKYNLKDEGNKNKTHLGFIIGKNRKYSKEIVALDKEGNEIGVDNYSMTSLCLQAIKEQQEQIEKLQKEIKTLKGDDK